MKPRILALTLLPTLIILNAGCSRSNSQQVSLRGQPTTRELLELKLKCGEAGRHFDAEREREKKGSTTLTFLYASRVAYNATLNTCIYQSSDLTPGVDGPGLGVSHYFIIDLATNQELAGYVYRKSDPNASRAEREEFAKRERELFGSTFY